MRQRRSGGGEADGEGCVLGGQALPLPPGYGLEHGADVLLLRRADGSVAATFSTGGVALSEVVRTAEVDRRRNGRR